MISITRSNNNKIMLELFAGTGSVGNVFRSDGWEVVSLDRDMRADIQIDILNWDYKVYEPGHFRFIWASPPCTEYSIAKTVGIRKIEEANEIVKRTLEIIDYLKPNYYVIENPQTGYLKSQPFMDNVPYNDVDYCKYGMPYRKRTRLWNNIAHWCPQPLCKRDCLSMNGNKHLQTAQRSPPGAKSTWGDRQSFNRTDLYKIPSELVKDIVGVVDPNNYILINHPTNPE